MIYLDAWLRNPTNHVTFGKAGSWTFDNGIARTLMIFAVDNSSSSHTDNQKNNFLLLGDGPVYVIDESFESLAKKFSINLK